MAAPDGAKVAMQSFREHIEFLSTQKQAAGLEQESEEFLVLANTSMACLETCVAKAEVFSYPQASELMGYLCKSALWR